MKNGKFWLESIINQIVSKKLSKVAYKILYTAFIFYSTLIPALDAINIPRINLQNVVRNWYARNEEIVETEDGLVRNAHDIAAAFQKGTVKS